MTRSFIAAGLNQEPRARKRNFRVKKQNCAGQTQRFTGFSSTPAQFARTTTRLSLQQTVGFQRIDEVFLRQHPAFESQRTGPAICVAKKVQKRAAAHNRLVTPGVKRLRLLNGSVAFVFMAHPSVTAS